MENRIFKRQPTKKDASDFSRQLDLVSDEAQAEEQKFLRSVDHDDELQDLRSKLLDATEALENAALEHPLVQEQRSRILLDKNVDPDRAFIQTERFIFLDNTHLFEHDFLDRLIHLRLQREWLWSIFQCRLWSHKKHDALLQAEDKVTSLFRGFVLLSRNPFVIDPTRVVSVLEKVLPSKSGMQLNLPLAPKPLHIYYKDVEAEYENGAPLPKVNLHDIEKEALRKASSFLATVILGDIDFSQELKDRYSILTSINNHLLPDDPRALLLSEYRDVMLHNIHFWEAANIKNLRTQRVFDLTIKMKEVQEAVAKKLLEQRNAKTKKMKEFLQRNLAQFKEKEEAKVVEYLEGVYQRLENKVLTLPARFKRDLTKLEFSHSRQAIVESGSKAIKDKAGGILRVLFSVKGNALHRKG